MIEFFVEKLNSSLLNLEKDVRAMEAAPHAAFAKFERRGEKFITLV